MAPRRHAGNSHSLLEIAGNDETQMENLVNHQQLTSSSNNTSNTSNNNNSSNSTCSSNINNNNNNNNNNNVARCCAPSGECLRANALIRSNSLQDVVKVICNNETCPMGQYMHRECFDAWEQTLLTYLKNCGRARSWSERQRHQNLWTKKGYDLAFKACGCRCGRGHLKKDLDWIPPVGFGSLTGTRAEEIETKKKKRRNRQNTRPSLAVSAGPPSANHNGHVNIRSGNVSEAQMIESLRGRAGSLSSSNGSSSPPATSETSISPLHLPQAIVKKKTKVDFFGETRIRQSCGANGIFLDDLTSALSTVCPELNSTPIISSSLFQCRKCSKCLSMEDEGNHGNDDTRCFILSTLAALQWSRVSCVLCRAAMLVFDRYPLVDGTFFLSPRQHSPSCAEVKVEGRTQYLSAVCMTCLEGCGSAPVRCRACTVQWDGSSLVLGTMYSYDIFAAMPCCTERLKCNSCQKPLIYPHQRLNFYSDYSRVFACPHCRVVDAHFVKPLLTCFTREQFQLYSQWP